MRVSQILLFGIACLCAYAGYTGIAPTDILDHVVAWFR
jgi:hypothetical protein